MSAASVIMRKRSTGAFDFHNVAYGTCVLDLDALDLTTLQTSSSVSTPVGNGGNVGRWADKSGSANHCDQAAGGARPTRNDNSINTHTSVLFGAGLYLASPSFTFAQGCTLYVVAYGNGSNDIAIDGGTANSRLIYFPSTTSANIYAGAVLGNTITAASTPAVICGVYNSTSSVARYNAAETSGDAGSSGDTGGLVIGSGPGGTGTQLHGGLGRVLAYSAAHTLAQRNAIQGALKSLWGTP